MRVTLAEMLRKITPKEGAKIESELAASARVEAERLRRAEENAALEVLEGPGRVQGIEVVYRRRRP